MIGILRTVESATMAWVLPLRIDKRLFEVLMAIACHAGENAYAALSTKLRGLSYVGTTYGVS